MTWLAWRQFRAAAISAAATLLALGMVLVATGPQLREEHTSLLAECRQLGRAGGGSCSTLAQEFSHEHRLMFLAVTGLVLIVPALIGLFLGAPLVAHEIETGTHRLVWHQSISRVRWLAIKLGVVGLASVLIAGATSAAVTLWAAPLDATAALDFPRMEPILFASRGVVPVGHAAAAFVVGALAGLLLQRSVPAMAVTLALLVVGQVAAPSLRASLITPITTMVEISDESSPFDLTRVGPDRVVLGPGESGAWILSTRTVDAAGRTVDSMAVSPIGPCSPGPDRDACFAEMRDLGYGLEVTYQPADRFWRLQLIETGIYTVLALGLATATLWRVQRPR
jgi:hypothetical protein